MKREDAIVDPAVSTDTPEPEIHVYLCFGKFNPDSDPGYFHYAVHRDAAESMFFRDPRNYACPVENIVRCNEDKKFSEEASALYRQLQGRMDPIVILIFIRKFLDAHRDMLHIPLLPV